MKRVSFFIWNHTIGPLEASDIVSNYGAAEFDRYNTTSTSIQAQCLGSKSELPRVFLSSTDKNKEIEKRNRSITDMGAIKILAESSVFIALTLS